MIREKIWQALEPALREAKHSLAGAPGALSDRDFLEAVLYFNRVGCPWRDLPPELGDWHAIYMRFRRSEKRGVWQRLWKNLQTERFDQARGVAPVAQRVALLAVGAVDQRGGAGFQALADAFPEPFAHHRADMPDIDAALRLQQPARQLAGLTARSIHGYLVSSSSPNSSTFTKPMRRQSSVRSRLPSSRQ